MNVFIDLAYFPPDILAVYTSVFRTTTQEIGQQTLAETSLKVTWTQATKYWKLNLGNDPPSWIQIHPIFVVSVGKYHTITPSKHYRQAALWDMDGILNVCPSIFIGIVLKVVEAWG